MHRCVAHAGANSTVVTIGKTVGPISNQMGLFFARLIHWKELNRHHKDSQMAATKKKPASKKPAAKKTDSPGFFPKVRSTKKNGLGSY